MSSSEASAAEAAKAASASTKHQIPWAHRYGRCGPGGPKGPGGFLRLVGGVTVLFFAAAGVKSVFGCNDRHWSPPTDGSAPAGSEEHFRGPPRMFAQWKERELNKRDEKLRGEFDAKIEELKQSFGSDSAPSTGGGKFWGTK
ncbi:PAB-dependent poly(A)-specific ribonuclease subunit 3 [Ascosphaera pollenicola]|nr:PAB-dependent poly(A)-specific ribonuclease subunit 3 [Ascosphaera pollenicola]